MQRRVAVFSLAILSAIVLLLWTGWTAWKTADQLAARLSEEEVESFRVGDSFAADLHELRSLFRKYEISRDPARWEAFVQGHRELETWLRGQLGSIHRPAELEILHRIDGVFAEYWAESSKIQAAISTNATRESVGPMIATLGDLAAEMAQDSRRLLAFREAALAEGVGIARSRLGGLVRLLLGTFATVVILSVILAVLIYRDLIRPLRIQLVETQDLAARNEKLASLGVLAAGVAHEIRNPLTAIKARLFTQQRRLPPGSPAASDAAIIDAEIHRLERIVRGFLEFARPSEPTLTHTSCQGLLRDVCELLTPDAQSRNATLRLESQQDVRVEADPAQLKQALINLVRNALEAVGDSGVVRLRCNTREQRTSAGTRRLAVLEVLDDGPGVPEDARSRLFDPFFTTKADGTGLGLSIAARIVQMHGGILEYHPNPDRGSTFSITIPSASCQLPANS